MVAMVFYVIFMGKSNKRYPFAKYFLYILHTLFIKFSHQHSLIYNIWSLKFNDYITCCFNGFWWLALIEVVNKEEKHLTYKFLHPRGQSGQFHWSRGEDIEITYPYMKIQTPTTSANGRTYFITEGEKNKTQNYFERTSV